MTKWLLLAACVLLVTNACEPEATMPTGNLTPLAPLPPPLPPPPPPPLPSFCGGVPPFFIPCLAICEFDGDFCDSDCDGWFDRIEFDFGYDPCNPFSPPFSPDPGDGATICDNCLFIKVKVAGRESDLDRMYSDLARQREAQIDEIQSAQ